MKARNITEKIMHGIFIVCGMISIVAVVGISAYMIISGLPAIKEIGLKEFLLGQVWKSTASEPLFGILPFIMSSFLATFGAILIGVPVGLLMSVFLSKIASPKLASAVRPAVELLAGITSRGLRTCRHDCPRAFCNGRFRSKERLDAVYGDYSSGSYDTSEHSQRQRKRA